MFSNPASFNNSQNAPIWLDEAKLVKALEGTDYQFNYEFMRAEQVDCHWILQHPPHPTLIPEHCHPTRILQHTARCPPLLFAASTLLNAASALLNAMHDCTRPFDSRVSAR